MPPKGPVILGEWHKVYAIVSHVEEFRLTQTSKGTEIEEEGKNDKDEKSYLTSSTFM